MNDSVFLIIAAHAESTSSVTRKGLSFLGLERKVGVFNFTRKLDFRSLRSVPQIAPSRALILIMLVFQRDSNRR